GIVDGSHAICARRILPVRFDRRPLGLAVEIERPGVDRSARGAAEADEALSLGIECGDTRKPTLWRRPDRRQLMPLRLAIELQLPDVVLPVDRIARVMLAIAAEDEQPVP